MDPNRKVLDLYGLFYLEEVAEVEEKLVIPVTLVLQEQLEILVLRGLVLFLLLVSLVI